MGDIFYAIGCGATHALDCNDNDEAGLYASIGFSIMIGTYIWSITDAVLWAKRINRERKKRAKKQQQYGHLFEFNLDRNKKMPLA